MSPLRKELAQAAGLAQWRVEQLYFFALTKAQPITHYVPLSEKAVELKTQVRCDERDCSGRVRMT